MKPYDFGAELFGIKRTEISRDQPGSIHLTILSDREEFGGGCVML